MFVLQPQSLVVEALLGEVLNLQKALHDFKHRSVEKRQGQIAERGVGQALLKGAAGRRPGERGRSPGPDPDPSPGPPAACLRSPGQLLDQAL